LAHNSRVGPHSTIGIELVHTVRFIVIFALLALQTRVALRANADSLSGLDECDFWSNTERRANNFCFSCQLPTSSNSYSTKMRTLDGKHTMPYTERKMLLPPPSRYGMQVARTNTASLDLDIDIVVAEGLWLELIELEISPMLRILDLEALEGVWINHLEQSITTSILQLLASSLRERASLREKRIEKRIERKERERKKEKRKSKDEWRK